MTALATSSRHCPIHHLSVFSSDYNLSGVHGAALREKTKPHGERAGRSTVSRSRPSSRAATTQKYGNTIVSPIKRIMGQRCRMAPAVHRRRLPITMVAPCPRVQGGANTIIKRTTNTAHHSELLFQRTNSKSMGQRLHTSPLVAERQDPGGTDRLPTDVKERPTVQRRASLAHKGE